MKIVKMSDYISERFHDSGVRRLEMIFGDAIDNGTKALGEMNTWRANGEYDISFDEAKGRLSYYINQMGLK